ncbi:MAG TPA: branched-chain amino acid ABC transporter permease, partial [Castellaniella sp.]|nr:branched-chain amino acid ABC transporter permease [Castellaniella sp.]
MRKTAYIGLGLLIVILAIIPSVVPNSYYLDIVIRMCINAIIVLSLNLLVGYAGQISLGHAGFVGMGAYASAVLPTHLGWHPLLAMGVGAACTGLLAL